jgi:hypothetical protein
MEEADILKSFLKGDSDEGLGLGISMEDVIPVIEDKKSEAIQDMDLKEVQKALIRNEDKNEEQDKAEENFKQDSQDALANLGKIKGASTNNIRKVSKAIKKHGRAAVRTKLKGNLDLYRKALKRVKRQEERLAKKQRESNPEK